MVRPTNKLKDFFGDAWESRRTFIDNINPHNSFVCSFCGYDWETEDCLDDDMEKTCLCGNRLTKTLTKKLIHDQIERVYLSADDLLKRLEGLEKQTIEKKLEFIGEWKAALKELILITKAPKRIGEFKDAENNK